MSEWWTYRLSDFLMFSPRTYWRLVAAYNRELWPLHAAVLASGAGLLWLAWRGRPLRIAGLLLALAWAWVGWAFHWARYAPINWGAQGLALAFAVQAALLLAWSAAPPAAPAALPGSGLRRAGLVLALAGLAYPLVGLAAGRPLAQAEVAGLLPDPTALFTLGMVLLAPVRAWARWALCAVPVLMLLAGLATHWAMAGVSK